MYTYFRELLGVSKGTLHTYSAYITTVNLESVHIYNILDKPVDVLCMKCTCYLHFNVYALQNKSLCITESALAA